MSAPHWYSQQSRYCDLPASEDVAGSPPVPPLWIATIPKDEVRAFRLGWQTPSGSWCSAEIVSTSRACGCQVCRRWLIGCCIRSRQCDSDKPGTGWPSACTGRNDCRGCPIATQWSQGSVWHAPFWTWDCRSSEVRCARVPVGREALKLALCDTPRPWSRWHPPAVAMPGSSGAVSGIDGRLTVLGGEGRVTAPRRVPPASP